MLISATHWREETTGLENRTVHFWATIQVCTHWRIYLSSVMTF
jgi:MarR-like DNA-binding transcriptional regulator SgrR of sgrS sRNA